MGKSTSVATKQASPSPLGDHGDGANVVDLRDADLESPEHVTKVLAAEVAEWEALDQIEKTELVRLVVDHCKRSTPSKVKLKRKPDQSWKVEPDAKSDLLGALKLQEAFSARTMDPVNARTRELLSYLGSVGSDDESGYNAALAFIESMKPNDQAEALLLLQMYVTHDAAIRALSQLGTSEWVPQMQAFGNLAAKLLRTSQAQMETLAKMRRGGEQVVRHIHVDNRGGQAIIAETVQGQRRGE